MGVIVEFLFELLIEGFAEAFLSSGEEFIPEKKLSGKKETVVVVIVIVITLLLGISLIIGGAMLHKTKGESDFGKVLVGFPVVYFVTGIVLKIARLVKKEKVGK